MFPCHCGFVSLIYFIAILSVPDPRVSRLRNKFQSRESKDNEKKLVKRDKGDSVSAIRMFC